MIYIGPEHALRNGRAVPVVPTKHVFWVGGNHHITMSQDLYDEWLRNIGLNTPKPQEVIETRPGRCECGSEAVGSSMHAPYCPAFEK